MPLYEYACQECEHKFETLVLGNEEVECPECHGTQLAKQLSVPARPRTAEASLPLGCSNPDAPPCGPACGRWKG